MTMNIGTDYVRLTELNGRRCDAVMFDYFDVSPDQDSGNYNFSRQPDVIDPETAWGSGFRFDLTALNVVDVNYNDGNDIYYDPNMDNVYGDTVLTVGGEVSWSWSEPVYYYGFSYYNQGSYDPTPVAAENIWVRVVEDGDYEEPENPDEPTEPDYPEYDGPTIADNLQRIIQAKSDIRVAIENKGVYVGDVTIDEYAYKIDEISASDAKPKLPNGISLSASTFTEFDLSQYDVSSIYEMGGFFNSCTNLKRVILGGSCVNAKNMSYMFYCCTKLSEVIIDNFNSRNLEDMTNMFAGCSNLVSLDLSKFNTESVKTMRMLFSNSKKLSHINISNWSTPNLVDMGYMFENCYNLSNIEGIEYLNTSNVTDMGHLFYYCQNLTSLDLSKWDTSNVTAMYFMFKGCIKLTELTMGGDVSNIEYTTGMFEGITTTGTFYYNENYDYSKIIAQLPSTWTAIPITIE